MMTNEQKQPTPQTCHTCQHYTPGWCKMYGSVIWQAEPVTRCKAQGVLDFGTANAPLTGQQKPGKVRAS